MRSRGCCTYRQPGEPCGAGPGAPGPVVVSKWYQRGMALTVRTHPEMEEALTALTQAGGSSLQEIIRRAVLDRFERRGHRARVKSASQSMLDRWGEVLDRLGRA